MIMMTETGFNASIVELRSNHRDVGLRPGCKALRGSSQMTIEERRGAR